jgi:hypothetical protein
MIRRVYDEPNPFGPELKRKRKKEEGETSTKASTSGGKGSRAIPPEQRFFYWN